MPTIAQSLVQTGFIKATSFSLKFKMESIDNVTRMDRQDEEHELGHEIKPCIVRIRSSTAAQLWIRSQRILLRDPVPPTQACVASDLDEVYLDSDDILAEEDNKWVGDVYRANDGDNILSESSETIDNGCSLPATPSIAPGGHYPGQLYRQPSSKLALENDPQEFDEELLFDSPLQKVASASDTP